MKPPSKLKRISLNNLGSIKVRFRELKQIKNKLKPNTNPTLTTNEDEDNYAITPTHRECMQYLDKIRLYVESHSTDNTFLYTFEQHMQNLAPKNKQTNILNYFTKYQ